MTGGAQLGAAAHRKQATGGPEGAPPAAACVGEPGGTNQADEPKRGCACATARVSHGGSMQLSPHARRERGRWSAPPAAGEAIT